MPIKDNIKIALCFAGHLRTAEYAADGFLRFIGDLLPNTDIFIHTWDQNAYKPRYKHSLGIQEILEKENIPIENLDKKILLTIDPPDTLTTLAKLKNLYKNKIASFEVSKVDPVLVRSLSLPVPRFYSWLKVNRLRQQYELDFSNKYDFVIKTRPDLVLPNDARLIDELEKLISYNDPNVFVYNNDVIYISNTVVMDKLIEPGFYEKIGKDEVFDYIAKTFSISRKRSLFSKFAIYRPEYIPGSSLDFDKCNYIDYYWNRHVTHTHSL